MLYYLIISMCCCVIHYHITSVHTSGFTTFQFLIVVFDQLRRKSPCSIVYAFL
jgi:hypothetical protein